jgi:hypothetical protein
METLDVQPARTQKHVIRRIDPWQAGKITAVITFFLMLVIFLPIMLIFGSVFSALDLPGGSAIGIVGAIVLPFIYAVIAYLFTALYCAIYNFAASKVGGMTVEVDVE